MNTFTRRDPFKAGAVATITAPLFQGQATAQMAGISPLDSTSGKYLIPIRNNIGLHCDTLANTSINGMDMDAMYGIVCHEC